MVEDKNINPEIEEVKPSKNKKQLDVEMSKEYNIELFLESFVSNEYYSALNDLHSSMPVSNKKELFIILDSFERVKVKINKESEVYQYLKNDSVIHTYSLMKFKYNLDISLMENDKQWYLIIANNSKVRIQLIEGVILAKLFV